MNITITSLISLNYLHATWSQFYWRSGVLGLFIEPSMDFPPVCRMSWNGKKSASLSFFFLLDSCFENLQFPFDIWLFGVLTSFVKVKQLHEGGQTIWWGTLVIKFLASYFLRGESGSSVVFYWTVYETHRFYNWLTDILPYAVKPLTIVRYAS